MSVAQYPTNIRASDDLPEARGPITPRPLPACSVSDASRTTGFCAPGGTTIRVFDNEALVRRLQRHPLALRRHHRQQHPKPMPTLHALQSSRANTGNCDIDGRQCTSAED